MESLVVLVQYRPFQFYSLLSNNGRPDIGIDRMKASDCYSHEQFIESFSSASYSKWDMQESSPYLQRSLVLVNGHLLVQVPKRSGILWKRIAHKEFGIISQTRCCWNSQKADVLFSVQRLYCPGVSSKAKDTENCRFTLLPTRKRLRLFSHNCLCKPAQSSRSSRRDM